MLPLILAAALATVPSSGYGGHRCFGCGTYGKTYVNTAGHVVNRPILSDEKPKGATGRCKDKYWTFSEQRQGACQGHGGVEVWLSR